MGAVMTKAQYLEKIIRDYVDTFGAGVPVFELPARTDDDLIKIISEALQSGRPIVPDTPDDPTIIY